MDDGRLQIRWSGQVRGAKVKADEGICECFLWMVRGCFDCICLERGARIVTTGGRTPRLNKKKVMSGKLLLMIQVSLR